MVKRDNAKKGKTMLSIRTGTFCFVREMRNLYYTWDHHFFFPPTYISGHLQQVISRVNNRIDKDLPPLLKNSCLQSSILTILSLNVCQK